MLNRAIPIAGSLSLAVAVLGGCSLAPPAAVVQKVDIPPTIERSADVRLTMDSGDIRLAGAAAGLVEGTLTYPGSDGKPLVSAGSRESTEGKVATVEIRQGRPAPATSGDRLIDLRLNGGLPMDLAVVEHSGDAVLDLSLVDARDLRIETDSGGTAVKLSGPHPSLSHVSFVSRSGETSIAANGEYPAIERFDVESASGGVRLDLGGTWKKDFTVRVRTASGNVTLVLPREVGVRVVGAPASGAVSAEGFSRTGGEWTRRSDKPSDFTLTVEVTLASGDLVLKEAAKK